MDYRKIAQEIYDHVGKKENLVSAAHCATRLRLVIADNAKCDDKAIENIEGVKGVFFASGQLQVILGTGTVNKVYDEFLEISGMTAATKADVKAAAAAQQNIFKRAIKALGDVFVPILPAIVASGLLMGLLEGLTKVNPALADSGTYAIFQCFSNAAFTFLPILIAISAARVFGGNLFLGAVIGMIMIHPSLINAWNVAGMKEAGEAIPTFGAWFGIYNVNMVGYQGHVIPVIISVWLMSNLEKKLHKVVPEMLDLFVTPLVTVLVTGYLTMTIIGPIFSTAETWVLNGVQYLISIPFGIGAFLMGAVYAPTVVCGVHHMYNVIEAGMLSATGVNTWMPIASAANVAQGAAALAVALKTRDHKLKALALPSSLSAFLGITEPAIFGVNLRLMKPFIAGCIGGACGALVGSIFKIGATAYGVTGVFGLLTTTDSTLQYIILMLVASGIGFAISWVIYKDAPKEVVETAQDLTAAKTEEATPKIQTEAKTVYAPLTGEMIEMNQIPDATFAAGILGHGVGIVPEKNEVVAPFDGEISSIFDTKHAVGVTSKDGIELLIHVGIDTVELNGQHFEAYVKEGDHVTVGQKLITFDADSIKKAGYNITTAVLITNTDDYTKINKEAMGRVASCAKIMTVE